MPIKPPRVFREINDFFGPDTTFVTAIGLYQIWSGQFQRTFLPRRYLVCGQAGPLGWEVPGGDGRQVRLPRPDQVVAVAGDYSFQFLMEEIAVAAQYRIPFVIVMINNEYLGLIRQAEIPYDMNYAVDLHYGEGGIDHVKVMEAFGCPARRVEQPGDIRDALAWAAQERERAPAAGPRRGDGRARGQRGDGAVPRRDQGVRARCPSRCSPLAIDWSD